MITYLILLLCIASIGYFKAKADELIHEYNYISEMWKFKYKVVFGIRIKPRGVPRECHQPVKNEGYNHWWYFGLHKPEYVEKFPYSSTLLVFLTDKWHLYNFFQYRLTHIAIVLFIPIDFWYKILLLFVLPVIQGVVFQMFYRKPPIY